MEHPDAEELAAVALGEQVPDRVLDHVAGCERCTSAVRGLVTISARVRATGAPADLPGAGPSPAVWEAVAAATAQGPSPGPAPDLVGTSVGTGSRSTSRRPSLALTAAAAVVGIVVGSLGTLVATSGDESAAPAPTTPTRSAASPVARASVEPLAGRTTAGSAVLTTTSAGPRLQIDLDRVDTVPSGHYLEAWLFDPATLDMVSVGVVPDGGATLSVPRDLDLDRFTSVDLSLEPLDADPAHAQSVAQGRLLRR